VLALTYGPTAAAGDTPTKVDSAVTPAREPLNGCTELGSEEIGNNRFELDIGQDRELPHMHRMTDESTSREALIGGVMR